MQDVDFQNTEIAFERKTNRELRKMRWLFNMMSRSWLVNWGSSLSLTALNWGLPVKGVIKNTVFEQFCGGQTLEKTESTIETLQEYGVETVLDYGAEAKNKEEEFDKTLSEFMKTVRFAGQHKSVPIISTKITGMARHDILMKVSGGEELSPEEQASWAGTKLRLNQLCRMAQENHVALFVDAEESWTQQAVDDLAETMMESYNKEYVVVYNTYQMYRHDRLDYLKASFARAKEKGYILGAKLVRGAYMEKERKRAEEMGYPSPIQPNKESTDRDYDIAVAFCVEHHDLIASCVASHNQRSTEYQMQLMKERSIPKDHPHLSFCQLYGMSDNITFNLAKAGYRVSKYVPFGPIKDVIPYLIRRAQENSAVGSEAGRELTLVNEELKRRKS